MKRLILAAALATLLSACSTIMDSFDAINPFASSGPKMAELKSIKATADARVVWRVSVGKGDGYAFMPAVVGATVYAAAKDGTVMRIEDGQQSWKINAGQTLSAGVGADRSIVVVGTPKGELLAFSASDGKPLWQSKIGNEILATPAVGDGQVVVRSVDNRLMGFDIQDGKRKWTYSRPAPALSVRVTAPPLLAGRFIFVGFQGGKLIAVSSANGAPMWEGTVAVPKGSTELDRAADITSQPVINGKDICAAAFQGRIACFDLNSGNMSWSRDMSSSSGVFVDGRYVYASDDRGAVHSLDRASGASIWKQDALFLRRLTAPLSKRNLIVVADAEGVVHFLDRDDGSFAARVTTDGTPVLVPMQYVGDNILVQTRNGTLAAIGLQ